MLEGKSEKPIDCRKSKSMKVIPKAKSLKNTNGHSVSAGLAADRNSRGAERGSIFATTLGTC